MADALNIHEGALKLKQLALQRCAASNGYPWTGTGTGTTLRPNSC